jgi:subtilisin family serine protease
MILRASWNVRRVQPLSVRFVLFLITAGFGLAQTAPAIEPSSDVAGVLRSADPSQQNHLLRLGAPAWHERGFRGQGMKVAIIDSGFRGFRSFLGKELPQQVVTRSFRIDGNMEARDSQHGILCAEVIHAVAPDAQLLFANWEPHHPTTFLDAVRWARQKGAQLISCSCIMPNWSDGEGGGAIHEGLASILGDGKNTGDILFFGCAGNTAQRHWSGAFRADADGFHQWTPGQRDDALTPWGAEDVSIELYCRPGTTYEVSVRDRSASGAVVVRSQSFCADDHCAAAARFHPESGRDYVVRVRALQGKSGQFHLVALQSDLAISRGDGSICFPGDGRYVMAVGAVDQQGSRCSYSAYGPNSTLPKPDLVAPVPFASRCRARPFSGTSAATPQAAAMAALLWSSHPEWSADAVRTSLLHAVHDLGPRGHDWQTGYGLVTLPTLPRGESRVSAYPSMR